MCVLPKNFWKAFSVVYYLVCDRCVWGRFAFRLLRALFAAASSSNAGQTLAERISNFKELGRPSRLQFRLCDALNFNQRSHRSQASHCKRFYAQSSFRTPLPQTTVLCFRLECTCAAECIIAFSVSWGRQVMSTTVLIFQPFLFQNTTVYKLATVNKRKPCFFST